MKRRTNAGSDGGRSLLLRREKLKLVWQDLRSATLGLCLLAFGSASGVADSALPAIVPWPQSLVTSNGYVPLVSTGQIIATDPGLAPLAGVLASEIYLATAMSLTPVTGTGGTTNDIVLRLTNSVTADEGYRLTVGPAGILVEGKTYRGVVWGTSTLLQAIQGGNPPGVPFMTVVDAPDSRATYRGVLIDLARNYHPVGALRPVIEMCRLYKIKYMQLHLNDEEGTAFPSQAFPTLQTSNRPYTWADLTNLVSYADTRGVTLVPEIEGPGAHAGNLRSLWGLGSTIDVFDEATYTGLNTLFGEVCTMFASSPYVHIGGDEGDYSGLGQTPEEQAYMATQGITGNPLGHYITRVHQILQNYGRQTICWEGFGGNGGGSGVAPLPTDLIVMPYESAYNPANNLIANGFSVVNTAWRPMYVVNGRHWPAEFIYDQWNMWLWLHHINLNLHIQIDPSVTNVLGPQMCAWEQPADLELPSLRVRLPAMSERAWNPAMDPTLIGVWTGYTNYAPRAAAADALLDRVLGMVDVQVEGVWGEVWGEDEGYVQLWNQPMTNSLPTEGGGPGSPGLYEIFNLPLTVSMSAPAIGSIHYTIDGTTPTTASPLYQTPFTLSSNNTHYAQFFYNQAGGHYDENGYVVDLQARIFDAGGLPIGDVTNVWHFWYQGGEVSISAQGLTGDAIGGVPTFLDPITVMLSAAGSGVIRYTLDGSEPTATSAAYIGPLVLAASNCTAHTILLTNGQYATNAPVVIIKAHQFSTDGVAAPGSTATATYWNTSPTLQQPDHQAPAAPTGLTATVLSSQCIVLTWSAPTDDFGVAGYQVFRNGVLAGSVSRTTYSDAYLTANTTYTYTVKARDATGNLSALSAPVVATTPAISGSSSVMLVEESFDGVGYTPGALLENCGNGGTGWAGPWTVSNSKSTTYPTFITNGVVADYPGLTQKGNALYLATATGSTPQSYSRSFASPLTDDGNTYWLAFQIKESNQKVWAYIDLLGYSDTSLLSLYGSSSVLPPSYYFLDDTNTSSTYQLVASSSAAYLFLFKIAFSGVTGTADDNVTVYVNPDLTKSPSTWTGTTRTIDLGGGITGIRFRSNNNGNANSYARFDEFRVGTTAQAALGHPDLPPDTQPPSMPVNLTATAISSSQIALSWSPATDNVGVVGYDVYRNGTNITTVTDTSYTSAGLAATLAYTYTVIARDGAGNASAASAPASATTFAAPVPDSQGPSAPQNLTATTVSQNAITLAWSASTDNVAVAEYVIFRDGVKIGTADGNPLAGGTVFTDTGLAAGTGHSYTVAAKDAMGNQSAASAPVSATTAGTSTGDTSAPSVPQNLAATAISQSAIALAWSPSLDNVGVAGYYVLRSGTTIATVNTTSYTDTGLAVLTPYSYTVKAFDAATNISAASAPASATTLGPDVQAPSMPTGLTATAISQSVIALTWTAATDNVAVAGYYVYRGGVNTATVSTTNYTNSGLAPSTLYRYTVAAFDAATNISAVSAPASTTTLAAAPVYAAETFDSYTAGTSINGANGGTGWTTAWAMSGVPGTNIAGNLSGLGAGNHLGLTIGSPIPTASRNWTGLDNSVGSTNWLAFWLESSGVKNTYTLSLNGATNGAMISMVGSSGWAAPTYKFFGTTVVPAATSAAQRFVEQIIITSGGGLKIICYVNPDLNTEPASWTAAATYSQPYSSAINGLVFKTDNDSATHTNLANLDEIRLAGSWQAAVGQTVTASPPQITDIHLTGPTGLALQWQSVSGTTYKVQFSTNLLTGFYDTSLTNIMATNSITSRTLTVGPSRTGFYRVEVVQ